MGTGLESIKAEKADCGAGLVNCYQPSPRSGKAATPEQSAGVLANLSGYGLASHPWWRFGSYQ